MVQKPWGGNVQSALDKAARLTLCSAGRAHRIRYRRLRELYQVLYRMEVLSVLRSSPSGI